MTVSANVASAPFLGLTSFALNQEAPSPALMRMQPTRSPFLSVYELEGAPVGVSHDDPTREAFATLVDSLHDEEFDEALYELESHARALHDQQLAIGATRSDADRVLTQHFAQLIHESEAMIGAMAREFGQRDEAGLLDQEFDEFLDNYEATSQLDPEFEDFFGKLIKKVGSVAKAAAGAAWKGIKTVALGPIFGQLGKLVRPLIDMVLKRAIGALPITVRPMAQKLAEKLGLAKPAPAPAPAMAPVGDASALQTGAVDAAMAMAVDPSADAAGTMAMDAAGADVPTAQQEFDELIASAFLAQNEDELNLEAAQLQASHAAGSPPVFAELDDARERFIQEMNDLRDGESAQPHIENFLPAILPALKLGLRLIGRQRVVNYLSPLLAKLIGGLIGPANAPALTQAIVNSGLKLLNLEMSDAEQNNLAGSAVAATVEETVARVAALPEYVLSNQELLEAFTLEAFEKAAAANLPAVFSEATYRRRPDLLEGGINAGWVMLPLRGPKRYKRCTRVFKVRMTPHMSEEVESFEAAPLSEYLEDSLGLPAGAEVEAEVHLYEALPGTTLADIARGEREVLGPGLSDEANASQLHPLTPRAAAVLLGRPGLGRMSGLDPRRLAVGQRLYHVAIPGRRPLGMAGPHAHTHHHAHGKLRRRFHLNVTLDSVQDQVRVCLFLSEVKAQKLAVQMRQQAAGGAVAVEFRNSIAKRLERIFGGGAPRRLRIVHASMPPGQQPAQAMQNLPRVSANLFASKMQEWLVQGFTEFLRMQSQQLLAATQDPADGVTLQFKIDKPAGLKELAQAAAGLVSPSLARIIAGGMAPTVNVAVVAGHGCV